MLKVCSKCQQRKALGEFALRWDNPKNRLPWCKTCKREYDRVTIAAKRRGLRHDQQKRNPKQ